MRTGKDINWLEVNFATYAKDEYLEDIPIFKIVIHYLDMTPLDNDTLTGYFIDQKVKVSKSSYLCEVGDALYNAEEFIELVEGQDKDPSPIIKELTGVDLDEYVSDVTYVNGVIELLDVKGKILLIGNWQRD